MTNKKKSLLEPGNRMVKENELMTKLQVGRSTIRRWVAEGAFPKPYKLGERAVGWLMSEVDEWLETRRTKDWG